VWTPKKDQRARGTHFLSGAEGGTSEHAESKPASEGHPQTVEHRRRDNEDTERKHLSKIVLTFYHACRARQLRASKQSQEEGHSLSEEHRGRDK
jgi:hypothetical protein